MLWTSLIDRNSNTIEENNNTSCIQQAYYQKNYKLFYNTIQNLQFNAQSIKNIKLIFIGDTLCDRGNSDYMTLLLYELMAKNKINFTIIVSNHDLGFIRQMELNTWYYNHNPNIACVVILAKARIQENIINTGCRGQAAA